MNLHEAAHDLLGVVVELRVREADARAVERDPGAPLHAHHEGAHREDHPQDVHVVWGQVLARLGGTVLAGSQSGGVGIPARKET